MANFINRWVLELGSQDLEVESAGEESVTLRICGRDLIEIGLDKEEAKALSEILYRLSQDRDIQIGEWEKMFRLLQSGHYRNPSPFTCRPDTEDPNANS